MASDKDDLAKLAFPSSTSIFFSHFDEWEYLVTTSILSEVCLDLDLFDLEHIFCWVDCWDASENTVLSVRVECSLIGSVP
jgi:hypothetical protein